MPAVSNIWPTNWIWPVEPDNPAFGAAPFAVLGHPHEQCLGHVLSTVLGLGQVPSSTGLSQCPGQAHECHLCWIRHGGRRGCQWAWSPLWSGLMPLIWSVESDEFDISDIYWWGHGTVVYPVTAFSLFILDIIYFSQKSFNYLKERVFYFFFPSVDMFKI